MPTWGDILAEINSTAQLLQARGLAASQHDIVRRKYLNLATQTTGRPTILYASAWLTNSNAPPQLLSVTDEDVHGFIEAVHGLAGPNLDLILHSPGGSGTAAEAIVKYLRTRFNHIRVIVPHMAMSAATMIACAANEIAMGKHSFLGPIDPQVQLQTGLGLRSVPAQTILDQFERALRDAADPVKLRVWAPMLSQYGPDLLVACENAAKLSEELVSEWLRSYMFNGQPDAEPKAREIARWLSDHNLFKTHSRPIARDALLAKGLAITELEQNQNEQDAFLSIYHAMAITFSSTAAVKIVENNLGRAFMKMNFAGLVQQFQLAPAPPPIAAPAPPAAPTQPPVAAPPT
jgi:hypothetical protein